VDRAGVEVDKGEGVMERFKFTTHDIWRDGSDKAGIEMSKIGETFRLLESKIHSRTTLVNESGEMIVDSSGYKMMSVTCLWELRGL